MVFNRSCVVFFRGILSSVEQLARELPKVRLCYYYVSKLMTDSKKGLSILTHLPWIHAAYQQHLDISTLVAHISVRNLAGLMKSSTFPRWQNFGAVIQFQRPTSNVTQTRYLLKNLNIPLQESPWLNLMHNLNVQM